MENETTSRDISNNPQPDTNKTLSGKEALDKLKEIAEKALICFFCTNIKTGLPISVCPTAVLEVDYAGNL